MISSDSRSATVTGLWSALRSTVTPARKWAICTRAAASATLRRPSASCCHLACVHGSCLRSAIRDSLAAASRRTCREPSHVERRSDEKTIPFSCRRTLACRPYAWQPERAKRVSRLARMRKRFCWPAWRAPSSEPPAASRSPHDHEGHSMTERAQPTDLELAALISSKICHDVIGPVGAIYNGLEILDEDDDARGQELRPRRHPQRHRAGLRAAAVRPLRLRRRRVGRSPDRARHRRADQPRPDRHRASTSSSGAAFPGTWPRTRSSCCST